MSTNIGTRRLNYRTEVGIVRRAGLPLILAAALLAALTYYLNASRELLELTAMARGGLVAAVPDKHPARRSINLAALAADPINQKVVNEAIAARAFATGDKTRAMSELSILHGMGWRSTAALQNLLWRAAMTRDLPLAMDTIEALLRRQRFLGQLYQFLNELGTQAAFRQILVDRLSTRPPWREYYLMSASELKNPAEIEGRYLAMRQLQQSGDLLERNEIAPILPKLVGIGRRGQAFDLWRSHVGDIDTPLADPDFSLAAKPVPTNALPIPFEWQMGSGSGYFASAGTDDRGSFLSIDWDGRGVPVFVSQITTARAGRYQLRVVADGSVSDIASRVAFRFVCPKGKSDFTQTSSRGGREMRLISDTIPCNFPILEMFGLVQPATSAVPIVLRTVRLEQIN